MSRFVFAATPLSGLFEVERSRIGDERGFLSRLFCANELAQCGWQGQIAQINQTSTAKAGTIRGMHFQCPPFSEQKLVSCLAGEVFDVAVDIRRGSPTFLQWHSAILSPDNMRSLFIPAGFAHGFQSLTDGCELLYLHSMHYAPDHEDGLNSADPALSIAWPMPCAVISARDESFRFIADNFSGIDL